MIKLTTEIVTQKGKQLETLIEELIRRRNGKVMFRGLGRKRPVHLQKILEVAKTMPRRKEFSRRMCTFPAALELIRKARKEDQTGTKKNQQGMSYEFRGMTPKGVVVRVHIREETDGKDKRLYLVAIFPGK